MRTKSLTVTTALSEKGQVVIPKSVRDQRGWEPGLRLVVEATPEGVTLRPLQATRAEAAATLLGITRYRGPRRSLRDMELAIRRGARRSRWTSK